jgi:hypothetical protein
MNSLGLAAYDKQCLSLTDVLLKLNNITGWPSLESDDHNMSL